MSTQIRGAQIRDLFAGDGLDWVAASGTDRNYLAVQVDNSSLEISGDALQVKAIGITNAMLAGSIADDKLAEDYIKTSEVDNSTVEFSGGSLNIVASGVTEVELNPSVAGDGLAGGGGTPLSVNVDGTTIQIVGDTLEVVSSGTGLDHGALNGLADDDHPQYLLTDGTRELSGTWNYGSETISGSGDIYTTGDVGIGVEPDSSYPLYVAGDVLFEDAGSNGGINIKYDDANNSEVVMFWNAGGWKYPLSISDTEANLLGFLDGYVGIGNAVFGTASGALGTRINEFSTDGTMAGNSDNAVPTEKAVVTYVNNEITTASGDILTYVSDNYIDNTEMTTISGDIIDYIDAVDHSIYSLVDGTRPFTGTVSGVTPTEDAHLTTKQYVDNQDTTISGDLVTYIDAQDTALSGALETNIIWEAVDSPYQRIQPKSTHQGKVLYHPGDATIGGDLTVTGTLFYASTETVQVEDNIMVLNYGEPGNGVTEGESGIEIDRGGFPAYRFIFDEPTDTFRVGVSGTEQAVATRQDAPSDTHVPWWNDTEKRFDTGADTYITINSGTDTITLGANSATELTIGTGGIALKNSSVDVNEILNTVDGDSIDASSTDDQLASAKLIYNEISTLSGTVGALDHDEDLNGLNGGDGVDYWHLNATAHTALSGVDAAQVATWDTAYSWGDHSGLYDAAGSAATAESNANSYTDSAITSHETTYDHTDMFYKSTDTLDDVPDGSSYQRVAANQLTASGIYIDATTAVKGIASFSSDNFDVTAGVVTVKDEGIVEAELDIANPPSDGLYLQYTTASGMQWTDLEVTDAVTETDIKLQNESTNCDGGTTGFTLDFTPVDNSLQVFLNGLIQEKGTGNDYTHTGTTVTFGIAPLAGDILLIHYIAQD